jgi:hypothetical protein
MSKIDEMRDAWIVQTSQPLCVTPPHTKFFFEFPMVCGYIEELHNETPHTIVLKATKEGHIVVTLLESEKK